MPDRSLLRLICAIAAIIFAVLWLFSVVVSGFAAPDWVPPSGLLAAAIALVL